MSDRIGSNVDKKSVRGFYLSESQLRTYKLGLALRNARMGNKTSLNGYLFEEILDREVRKQIEEFRKLFGNDQVEGFIGKVKI